MRDRLKGPLAALLTPRRFDGEVDREAFCRALELLLSHGIRGITIGGTTGEYMIATAGERETLLELARQALRGTGPLVYGAGAAHIAESVRLGRRALAAGADVVLLPPPHFFDYAPSDVEAFYREAASQINGPVLLYNLPAHISPVTTDVALRLITSVPNIIGIKDSSGSLATLQALTESGTGACRLSGHDATLCQALLDQICDGAISGIAAALPELIVALFAAHETKDVAQFAFLRERLNEVAGWLETFPGPWGLKIIAHDRGLCEAWFPLPLSGARKSQIAAFQSWLKDWWARCDLGPYRLS